MRSIALSVVAILYGLANFYIGNKIINIVRPYFAFQISIFAYFLVFALALVCGGKAGKHGNMNINTAGAVKRCVHYMQKKTR